MKSVDPLEASRIHLAGLVEAVERCVYFLDTLTSKLPSPLRAEMLHARRKDAAFFETLAAINERFAKLQDVLASAFRHATLLAGEKTNTFLEVLAFFEKLGVVSSSHEWQRIRILRNLAAHDYETDYASVAAHFNSLVTAEPVLVTTAGRFVAWCRKSLEICPASADFTTDFDRIVMSRSIAAKRDNSGKAEAATPEGK